MKKKTIGLIVAVEIKPILKKFNLKPSKVKSVKGYKIYKYSKNKYDLIIVDSGIGEVAAAASTQLLISLFNVDMILNFGLVGGLSKKMNSQSIAIIDSVVHYDFDISKIDDVDENQYLEYDSKYIKTNRKLFNIALKKYKDLIPVVCASGDRFVNDKEEKKYLFKKYNADICEMESAAILLVANRNKVPSLFIKIVSDALDEGAEQYKEIKDKASSTCFEIVESIIDNI